MQVMETSECPTEDSRQPSSQQFWVESFTGLHRPRHITHARAPNSTPSENSSTPRHSFLSWFPAYYNLPSYILLCAYNPCTQLCSRSTHVSAHHIYNFSPMFWYQEVAQLTFSLGFSFITILLFPNVVLWLSRRANVSRFTGFPVCKFVPGLCRSCALQHAICSTCCLIHIGFLRLIIWPWR
jgi:hypothetical protein